MIETVEPGLTSGDVRAVDAACAQSSRGGERAEKVDVVVTGGRRIASATVITLLGAGMTSVAPAIGAEPLRVAPSVNVARTGSSVAVRGSIDVKDIRVVSLQRLVGRTWRTVDTDTSSGTITLKVPSSTAGVFTYRVVAPAVDGLPGQTSKAFTVAFGAGNLDDNAYLTAPPVRWDPCTPIGYRVNVQGAPPRALKDIKTAVARASLATGIAMRYQGTTEVVPGEDGASTPSTYPAGTHLVIAWAAPSQTALLKDRSNVLGVGGVFYDTSVQKVGRQNWHRAVQGYVVLNTAKDLPSGFGRGRAVGELGTWGQVIMHEVGHTLGLDHPEGNAKAQIMYPETTRKVAQWGAGDLTALRRLGKTSGCFAKPSGDVAASPTTAMVAGRASLPAARRH